MAGRPLFTEVSSPRDEESVNQIQRSFLFQFATSSYPHDLDEIDIDDAIYRKNICVSAVPCSICENEFK
jgi:hypothetical protein